MNKQFVTYEIALKLKELGFNEECFSMYDTEGGLYHGYQSYSVVIFSNLMEENYNVNGIRRFKCAAPLWQQAIDFLREKYDVVVETMPGGRKGMFYVFVGGYIYEGKDEIKLFNFQAAREAAILRGIEIVEQLEAIRDVEN